MRWLRPIFAIGSKRTIEEDDIYEVENDMRSELHTEAFAKQWELECKKKKPSLFRVMLKMYLYKLLPFGFLYAACETAIKYEHTRCEQQLPKYLEMITIHLFVQGVIS